MVDARSASPTGITIGRPRPSNTKPSSPATVVYVLLRPLPSPKSNTFPGLHSTSTVLPASTGTRTISPNGTRYDFPSTIAVKHSSPAFAVPTGARQSAIRIKQSFSNTSVAASGNRVERMPSCGIMKIESLASVVRPCGAYASIIINAVCASFGACARTPPLPISMSSSNMSTSVEPLAFCSKMSLMSRCCCTPTISRASDLWCSNARRSASRLAACSIWRSRKS